jgi:ubiquinone/menaquinone biosynthesis C-methylase UbiE
MAYVDFIMALHQSTTRDYIERVTSHDKAECAEIAIKFGEDYWDGERQYGYGGYKYDGRWNAVAKAMADYYDLKPGARILDVGSGKGFLLYEFTQLIPEAEVAGIDISEYGIAHAKEEVRPFLKLGSAVSLPFPDNSFDFVVSVNTLHNLKNFELWDAIREIERVGRGPKHIVIESYRNEREKANLLYWQLTCRTFWSPEEWEWFFEQAGYTGDYSYIVFE